MSRLVDLARLFPVERHDDPAVERAVLGALITGALSWRDAAHLEAEDFYYVAHLDLLCALQAASETRPSRHRGLGLAWAVQAARALGCSLAGDVYVDGRGRTVVLGYLATCAREAPGRSQARQALARLRDLRIERYEASERRERAIEDFGGWAEEVAGHLLEDAIDRETASIVEPIESVRERRGVGPVSSPASGRAA